MPSRLTLTAFAAAGSLVAVPALAAGAVFGIQDDRLAATPVNEVQTRLDLASQTGARVARVDLFWSEIAPTRPANPADPNDPSYDWRATDAKIVGLVNRGVTPLISVYSSPSWSTGGKRTDTQYNAYAPAVGDYGQFMSAVATRYSGTFTPAVYGTTPLPRVRLIEVWNEPSINQFLIPGGPRLAVYLRLLREAYPAVKAANPKAIVIAGVGSPRSTGGAGNTGAREWVRGIAGSPLSVKFDAFSQHIYPAAAPLSRTRAFPSWNSINELLGILDARRAREIAAAPRGKKRLKVRQAPKMRLYITEAGYTTAATKFRTVKVSEATQAKYLRQIARHPQVKGNRRVSAIIWFNLQDNPSWPGGLLREDGTRKVAFAAFAGLAGKGVLTPDLRR